MDTEGAGVGAPAEALGEGLGDGEGAEGLGGGEGGDGGEGGGDGGDGGEGGAGEPDTRTPVVQVASHFCGGRAGAGMVSLAGWLLVAGAVHTPALCARPRTGILMVVPGCTRLGSVNCGLRLMSSAAVVPSLTAMLDRVSPLRMAYSRQRVTPSVGNPVTLPAPQVLVSKGGMLTCTGRAPALRHSGHGVLQVQPHSGRGDWPSTWRLCCRRGQERPPPTHPLAGAEGGGGVEAGVDGQQVVDGHVKACRDVGQVVARLDHVDAAGGGAVVGVGAGAGPAGGRRGREAAERSAFGSARQRTGKFAGCQCILPALPAAAHPAAASPGRQAQLLADAQRGGAVHNVGVERLQVVDVHAKLGSHAAQGVACSRARRRGCLSQEEQRYHHGHRTLLPPWCRLPTKRT